MEQLWSMPWFAPTGPPDPAWRVSDSRQDAAALATNGGDVAEPLRDALVGIQRTRREWQDNTRVFTEEHLTGIVHLLCGQTPEREVPSELRSLWGAIEADLDVVDDLLRDVILMGNLLLCDGLDVDRALTREVQARWAIWRAGYGVHSFKPGKYSLGKFTVYRQPSP